LPNRLEAICRYERIACTASLVDAEREPDQGADAFSFTLLRIEFQVVGLGQWCEPSADLLRWCRLLKKEPTVASTPGAFKVEGCTHRCDLPSHPLQDN
jgi:hypothetical protein